MGTDISVWDKNGIEVERISLPYSIIPSTGRTSKIEGTSLYLKGAGVKYTGHNLYENFYPEEFEHIEYHNIIPGIVASGTKRCFIGKSGIFMERFQPYFRDYIGSCGPKERKILNNQSMPLSGVSVEEEIPTGIPGYFIYKCQYLEKRNNIPPLAKNIIPLIQMISEGIWYCPWDKNLYNDLDSLGNIRDVADWSRSENPSFTKAIGTLYSLIYSLFKNNRMELNQLLKEYNINFGVSPFSIPAICVGLIKYYNSKIVPNDVNVEVSTDLYRKIFLDYILNCDPCACLDLKDEFSWIRDEYRNRFLNSQK